MVGNVFWEERYYLFSVGLVAFSLFDLLRESAYIISCSRHFPVLLGER